MTEVMLGGRRLKVQPAQSIGTGGEADVYDIGSGLALKLYKGPDHPDYKGRPEEIDAARERLRTRWEKLRDFPAGLPGRVVAPQQLALDRAGRVVGYAMRLVPGAEPLLKWSDPSFRRAVPNAAVAPLFLDLHATVARLHELGIVVGDFNDLNVLTAHGAAHLIDADSFQFGPHACLAYTDRFVDPLVCDQGLRPSKAHSTASDWYAFDVMLFQSLLLVHPYGGVLPGPGRPADRTLHRVTVFDPKVRYPKAAVPWKALPDELLHRFHETFAQDVRAPFPRALLDGLCWTRCASCGLAHARAACPVCAGAQVHARRQLVVIRGRVKATRLLDTDGEILAVSASGWLVYGGGEYRREDGRTVALGALRPGMRFFLDGENTLAAQPGEAFAHAARRSYWERDGALWRDGALGDERIGEVLAGQTRLWSGPEFGFGFYRAGGLTVGFTFHPERKGLNDGVVLPPMRGRVLDAACVFGPGRAWLLLQLELGGKLTRRCVVIKKDGTVAASVDAPAWLESLHGACAAGPHLFVPTDRGIVRVQEDLSLTTEYAETEPFVDSASRLAAGPDGIVVANRREILKLEVTQEATV
ncbi:MAG: hypothetical protein HY925_14160 [Elusimicrobia bacterium]|nr:hypothetical protein [Elusimicrobiota bacterium]